MKAALIILGVLCVVLLVACLGLLALVIADVNEDDIEPPSPTSTHPVDRLRQAGL